MSGIIPDACSYSINKIRFQNSNTWGFSSKIGPQTFADYNYTVTCNFEKRKITSVWKITPEQRANVRKVMRKATDIFDICGYIPGIQFISGLIRYIGASLIGNAVRQKIKENVFNGHLANEALRTIHAQKERAIYEMFILIGSIINLSLDIKWYRKWRAYIVD